VIIIYFFLLLIKELKAGYEIKISFFFSNMNFGNERSYLELFLSTNGPMKLNIAL
jgi:hypothetical protein